MAETIYFQWQNEFLKRTIYPLRDLKLSDFLLYYFEIETWEAYKDKTLADLQPEVNAYLEKQHKKVTDACDTFNRLLAYMIDPDVTDTYPSGDPDVLRAINGKHALFKQFFPTYNNPVKERYFTAERARELVDLQKRINALTKDRQRWTNVLQPMFDGELKQMYDFLEAQERLAGFRKILKEERKKQDQRLTSCKTKFKSNTVVIETQQAALKKAQRVLKRYQQRQNGAAHRAYFMTKEITGKLNHDFPELEPAVVKQISDLHAVFAQAFAKQAAPTAQLGFIRQRTVEFEPIVKRKANELAGKIRALGWTAETAPQRPALDSAIARLRPGLQALEEEMALLQDFAWAYESQAKKPAEASALLNKVQVEAEGINAKLRAAQSENAALDGEIRQIEAGLAVPEKDALVALASSAQVTVKQIVQEKVETRHKQLLAMNTQQLLEEIVRRFVSDPNSYPLWLQYMVIHFSGMRYQSAHGSWADPKQLLQAVRIKAVEAALKRSQADAIAAMCEQKWLCYQAAAGGSATLGKESAPPPALATTKDPEWRERITRHLRALDPARGMSRMRVLLDLLTDEEVYEVEKMTDKQALDELEAMRSELPDWLWKDIVRLTDLRLKHVKDLDWENIALNDPDRYRRETQAYNEALNEWKRANLTGWREEHEQTNQLIVTRAVCNEVAEHIQHQRGHKPPGGLTAKPEWYLRAERDPRLAGLENRPFLRKPKTGADFVTGASILWLRWVRKQPNAWQVTVPIALNNGEELIPLISDDKQTVVNTGKSFQRTVITKDAAGNEHRASEWLRWMHEATVVKVAETVDGPTVLTFETARPGDDRLQSTIGVMKHHLTNLRYLVTSDVMNATFTGYIPEANVPYDRLRELLDWNHILLRDAYNPEQIEAYWQAVMRPPEIPVSFSAMFREECMVEAAPRLHPSIPARKLLLYERGENGMVVYQPVVELERGTRFIISKSDVEEDESGRYFLVTSCEAEPRAEGLYTWGDDWIDAPEETLLRVRAKRYAAMHRLSGADEEGNPIFQPAGMTLRGGAEAWVSTIHRAAPTDTGDGVVRGHGRSRYFLIARCDATPDRQGCFVRIGDVAWNP